jgi:NAD(P)-dependent dehydrogenase (short-subunit alcohol dehydrogenase family)
METGVIEKEFKGVHAIVTGGGAGIGAAIAEALAARGADLSLIGRNEERLKRHCGELQRRFGIAAGYQVADLTTREAIEPAFATLIAARGPAGLLVNNAGGVETAPILRTTEDMLDRQLTINVKQAVFCTQAALPEMSKLEYGRIVNIASVAGLRGQAYVTAYCISKHAMVGFTRALAVELVKTAVTVNAVCPGYTETELVERTAANVAAKAHRGVDDIKQGFAQRNPSGRIIKPAEVADTVAWLCSRSSAAINGQAIEIG